MSESGSITPSPILGVLSFTHHVLSQVIQPGDWVVDATMGNGHDTLFLATAVGPTGRLFGVDIQPAAMMATRNRLRRALAEEDQPTLTLALIGHESLGLWLDRAGVESSLAVRPEQAWATRPQRKLRAAMFNLGYLPGGSREILTQPETTVNGLQAVWERLEVGGMVTVVQYRGHPGGASEAEVVQRWAANLVPHEARVLCYHFLDPRNPSPFLCVIEKKTKSLLRMDQDDFTMV